MKKSIKNPTQLRNNVLSIIALVVFLLSLVSCASPQCGYMKHYQRDVRMGIAH